MAAEGRLPFIEQLSAESREKIRRSSSERLRAKLMEAGVQQSEVERITREQLMERCAELLVGRPARFDEGDVGAVASVKTTLPAAVIETSEWDAARIEFEREKLAFEERRIAAQKELKMLEIAAAKEQREHEREMKLMEVEAQRRVEEARLRQNAEYHDFQREETLRKRDLENSPAYKAKLFGDAMRGTLAKMPQDAIELLPYFRQVEQLFKEFKVDKELRVHLLKPHITETARNLIARMSPGDATDFDKVKAVLLHEFKLSPAALLERFNTLNRVNQETYTLYANRLKSVVTHYVECRKAAKYDLLLELLVCDRVKASLSESALRYVLSLESKEDGNWLHLSGLTEALDLYYDSHLSNDKPRYVSTAVSNFNSKPSVQNRVPPPRPPPPGNAKAFNRNSNPGRRCYTCGSTEHLKAFHEIGKTGTGAAKNTPAKPKNVSALSALSESVVVNVAPVAATSVESADVGLSSCERMNEPASAIAATTVVRAAAANSATSKNNVVQVRQQTVSGNNETAMKACVCDVIVTDCNVRPDEYMSTGPRDVVSANNESIDEVMSSIADDFAKLQYLDVCLSDCDDNRIAMSAMVDSGAEVCLANANELSALNLSKIGTVTLAGAIGGMVTADLVKLRIAHADCPTEQINFVCAVTDSATHALIINTEIIARLQQLKSSQISAGTTSREESDDLGDDGNLTRDMDVRSAQANDDSLGRTDNDTANQLSDVHILINEQRNDETLRGSYTLAKKKKGNLYVRNDVLYRRDKISGQVVEQLVLPTERRTQVLKLAHDLNHMAWKSTYKRLKISFWWPTIVADTKSYVMTCDKCSRRARVTVYDSVPIKSIERSEIPFNHLFCDACGPIGDTTKSGVYQYFFVACDNLTRYPCAFALKKITAQTVCDCLLKIWSIFGISQFISLDNAAVHRKKLTQLLLEKVCCTPIFITPHHSAGNSLAERTIGTIKEAIHRVACDHPKQWWRYIDFVLWAMREIPHSSLGVSSYELAFGRTMRGVGSILKDTWTGDTELPPDLNKPVVEYLCDLRERLATAHGYANAHLVNEQKRWVTRYNLRSRDKQFSDGESVMILAPDDTSSRMWSRWKAPAKIINRVSDYSYLVEYDGARHVIHANKLRRYNVRVNSVQCNTVLYVDGYISSDAHVSTGICEEHDEFGHVPTVNVCGYNFEELLPSQKIDPNCLSHLSVKERRELLNVLDRYPSCFSEKPGLCTLVEHEIVVTSDFKPKRMKPYRIPEKLKPEVEKQVKHLLEQNIVRESTSPMCSPLMALLKKDQSVRCV
jgi:hypothetical protein